MYLDFYALKHAPFSITPDPRFVFLTERHRDALAHLLFGIGQGGSGGFVLLSGEIGTGKTTICRLLMEQLPENTKVALILNPKLTPLELLISIAEELRIETKGASVSAKKLIDRLNQYLLDQYAAGQRIVLIIDEAQNLSVAALEQIRLLTNLETATQKLLQIILLGQPELRDLVAKPELQQLAQRITARYHLAPLSEAETTAYLRHRIAVAGAPRFPFEAEAVRAIHRRAGGVPRLINVIADRALLAGFVGEAFPVTKALVQRAADEVLGEDQQARWFNGGEISRALTTWFNFKTHFWHALMASVMVLSVFTVIFFLGRHWHSSGMGVAIDPSSEQTAKSDSAVSQLQSTPVADARAQLAAFDAKQDGTAFVELLQNWQQPRDAKAVERLMRCPFELSATERCWRGTANDSKLRAFNTPVIVLLRDQKLLRPALLLGMNDTTVQLSVAGKPWTLSRAALAQIWFGDYLAYYTVPENFPAQWRSDRTRPRDVLARWVHERMHELTRERADQVASSPSMSATIDATELQKKIAETQLRSGLMPDGVVGAETQLLLSARGPSAPHLSMK